MTTHAAICFVPQKNDVPSPSNFSLAEPLSAIFVFNDFRENWFRSSDFHFSPGNPPADTFNNFFECRAGYRPGENGGLIFLSPFRGGNDAVRQLSD
jgi:hypothetical protein